MKRSSAQEQTQTAAILFGTSALMVIAGMVHDGARSALAGLVAIQTSPSRLLTDFVEVGGVGGALVNAALVGALGLWMARRARVQVSGAVFAAYFTLVGFGFFGKTPLNILPIFLGVYLAARCVGKGFREYSLIALFGSAMGPLTSFIAMELGLSEFYGIPAALLGGVAVGCLLPGVAIAMLHMHQGYNLYNIGISCGFLGLFATSMLRKTGADLTIIETWGEESSTLLFWLPTVLCGCLVVAGVLWEGRGLLPGWRRILRQAGRLPTDFMDTASPGSAFVNAGVMGWGGTALLLAVGAPFNGPVLGALFTLIGFAAFGSHPRNSWPLIAGVLLGTLLFSKPLDTPGVILALLFCTTLAPLAGQFGVGVGVLAGVMHLAMVMEVGPWHGGMNLYNNGFAGGLTATLLVSIIDWYRSNRVEAKREPSVYAKRLPAASRPE